MSEMLGNQYFMARNFSAAQKELEGSLIKYPNSKPIKKRLIICYTQTEKLNVALRLFLDLITEDIEFIVKTDPERDDCPCPELIKLLEEQKDLNSNSLDYHLASGILWFYCDVNNSLNFFKKAKELAPGDPEIGTAIKIIQDYLLTHAIIN